MVHEEDEIVDVWVDTFSVEAFELERSVKEGSSVAMVVFVVDVEKLHTFADGDNPLFQDTFEKEVRQRKVGRDESDF